MGSGERGGAERVTMLLLAHHDRSRYEPVVLFLNGGSLVDDVRAMGLATHVLAGPLHMRHPHQVLAAARAVRRLLRQERIDIFHSCMSYTHIISGLGSLGTGVPGVLFQHGPVGGWIDRAASVLPVARVIANSRHTMERHRGVSLRRHPIEVVHCATELQTTDEEARRFRDGINTAWNVPESAIVLGAIGRFDPWKGIDIALRAAAPVLRERPGTRFVVVGDQYRHFHPGYAARLRELVKEAGLSSQVLFVGFQRDVRPWIARMDILVHSAITPEPFGLVILEGMAAGRAVIASRAGGPLEIITEGHDGLFHEPGDVAGLETCIRRLIDDGDLRRALGAQARGSVARRFTPTVMVRRMEEQYDTVLGLARA
jgi:glycosyltransferase involved in cell wall biosynthesis